MLQNNEILPGLTHIDLSLNNQSFILTTFRLQLIQFLQSSQVFLLQCSSYLLVFGFGMLDMFLFFLNHLLKLLYIFELLFLVECILIIIINFNYLFLSSFYPIFEVIDFSESVLLVILQLQQSIIHQ